MTSYSPAEVENLTYWTPEGQRNLRRNGYLDNYGFQRNGRWRYSPRDIAAFWMASELYGLHRTTGGGLDLRTILATAWTNAEFLIFHMNGKTAPRYVAFISRCDREDSKDGMALSGTEVKTMFDLGELAKERFDDVYLINLERLAKTAPATIREAIIS